MLYHLYELNHATMAPARATAQAVRVALSNPTNPMANTLMGKSMLAAAALFERSTRRYAKPEFGITQVEIDGKTVAVRENIVWQKPFCRLLHFERDLPAKRAADPKLLIVAPMSGHYATLLRGTVTTMLEHHDVYITEWTDARTVPLLDGSFGFDDYIDYVIEILGTLGGGAHVMAVCQPSVPVLAAISLMQADGDKASPASMILMGGPVDTRINPTGVNQLAESRGTDWFKRNVIVKVPFPHAGFMRDVYPGFLQLSGFMSMNLDRHVTAHRELFVHMIEGDGDSVERHEEFYDEYLAVMDLTAEFYLETVEKVFVTHALPKGELTYRGVKVDPGAITQVALMTIEGEHDDISGVGQTKASHKLCPNIPQSRKHH
ncbi:MAG: polyhydroxyalkanoate depolymerase, partial [Alphaproteobacteria bacterium]